MWGFLGGLSCLSLRFGQVQGCGDQANKTPAHPPTPHPTPHPPTPTLTPPPTHPLTHPHQPTQTQTPTPTPTRTRTQTQTSNKSFMSGFPTILVPLICGGHSTLSLVRNLFVHFNNSSLRPRETRTRDPRNKISPFSVLGFGSLLISCLGTLQTPPLNGNPKSEPPNPNPQTKTTLSTVCGF